MFDPLHNSFADLAAKRTATAHSVARGVAVLEALPKQGNSCVLDGSAAPLGSITDFASASVVESPDSLLLGDEFFDLTDAHRDYCRRLHARRLAGQLLKLTASRRINGCGYRPVDRAKGVAVWQRPDAGRGRFSGVCLCGSSWSCPMCAPRIAAGRVGEVKEWAQAVESMGLSLVMETFTLPHTRKDSVKSLLQIIQKARRGMSSGRVSDSLRIGRLAYYDAGELTWGHNGPNPHVHRLSAVNSDEYDTQAQRSEWLRQLASVGRNTYGTSEHAYNCVTLNASSARYISKIGLETASSALQTKDSLTPLGMVYGMADGKLNRMPWAANFRECVEALRVTKFAALRCSRGGRLAVGLINEKTDADLAKENESQADILLGYLNELQWIHIRKEKLDGSLLNHAQYGRVAVNSFLQKYNLGYLHDDK